jgi:uncharacterized membrane protein (UPF0127 family)
MSKIALLPGGFKPPHAGHYNMAKWLASNTDADTVVIKVGAKERDGITREMSLRLWNLYRTTDKDPLAKKLTILPSESPSPVRDVYDFVEKEAPENSTIYLGMGEKDINDKRFSNIGKFAEPRGITFKTSLVPPQAGGVSGTEMRGFIKDNNKESFQKYLPDHIDKDKAWDLVSSIEEDFYDPRNKYYDFAKSSEYKAGYRGKKDIPRKGDQIHNRQTAPVSWEEGLTTHEKIHQLYELGGTMTRQEMAKHNKNLRRLKKDLKRLDKQNKYYEVPKYLKGTLTRKLYENHGTSTATINGHFIPLEIMDTPELQMQGMIGRDSLKGGMVFPYNNISQRDFHMQNCKIPLDIIFIVNNKINKIEHNAPPCKGGWCPKYSGKADNVLELPGGYCKKHNINIGDNIGLNLNKIPKQLNELDKEDIKSIDNFADKQLDPVDVDLTSKHFFDRLNDPRNDKKISNAELIGFFKRLAKKKKELFDFLSKYKEVVASDNRTDINIPFLKQVDKIIAKTIMRKKDFQTTNPQLSLETRLFSKNWWLNILTEGGAAGHMAHPFNLPNVNSGKDLKDIFEKSANSLQTNPGAVKIDGVNSSIRLVDLDGKKQFVMDRGSKKPLDIKGITKDDLLNRFGDGHGMVKVGGEVLDMFNEALPSLENDLKKLGAWENPNILFNMEYVSGKTNVQEYGSNFIAIHGLNKIESKEVQGARKMLTKRVSSEISYDKNALESLLKNLEPTAKKRGYEIYGSVPTKMKKKPNFNSALSKRYTIEAGENTETKSLGEWLNILNNIPEESFIFMNVNGTRKKVGAVSKQVYLAILQGENIDDLFETSEDRQKAVEGFTTYLATEKLGDEVLKVLDSPMGSVENHEGVVIRDKSIASVPFKITGKFILGGLATGFR